MKPVRCRECEEQIAVAARAAGEQAPLGALPDEAARHLADCPLCQEFRERMGVVAGLLSTWQAPAAPARSLERCKAVLVARLARGAAREGRPAATLFDGWPPGPNGGELPRRVFQHPALLGVLGAAALAAGAAVAPGWVQQIAIGWTAGAAVLASLVLLCHGRPAALQGERA